MNTELLTASLSFMLFCFPISYIFGRTSIDTHMKTQQFSYPSYQNKVTEGLQVHMTHQNQLLLR